METQVGFYFKKISEKLEKRANCKSGDQDVTFSQGKVLWYLHKREKEDVTLRDIEKFFDCSHATVSGIVSRLEEKGYVVLETSESDRRAKNVRITEKEKASFRCMRSRQQETEEWLLREFSDEEKKLLTEYLQRVYANLELDAETPLAGERKCPRRPCGRRGHGEDES